MIQQCFFDTVYIVVNRLIAVLPVIKADLIPGQNLCPMGAAQGSNLLNQFF